ncbi:MAG: aminodeoxychorismate synthase component I [Bacteroidota bacterium]
MKTLHAEDAKNYMNELGTKNQPYLAIISFDMQQNHVFPLNASFESECLYHFPGGTNVKPSPASQVNTKLDFTPLSFSDYLQAYSKIIHHINRGDSYLCNLCFETELDIHDKTENLFHVSHARYKLWLNNRFVCFSPESFVKTKNNTIYTYPMKGTIDAGEKDAEHKLLSDPKEKAEHFTITDLLRNDLSMVSRDAEVSRYRYVEKLKTSRNNLLQTSTEIKGILNKNWRSHTGDLLFTLLPAGSITGAPKQKTIDIINKTEKHERGYYTGVACLFDGNNLDSFVMIRMITQKNGKYFYKSGGGITSLSNPEQEYKEMIQKIYVPVH